MKIERLTVEEVLPVRHEVLWPDKPLSFCKLDDDNEGEHFGIRMNGLVVCIASTFTKNNEVRLRKFATRHKFQGKGLGSSMLKFLINKYQKEGYAKFWFDARESAIPFYQKFGFSTEGEKLFKSQVPYFKMTKSLL